jgi:hypothetical protein
MSDCPESGQSDIGVGIQDTFPRFLESGVIFEKSAQAGDCNA